MKTVVKRTFYDVTVKIIFNWHKLKKNFRERGWQKQSNEGQGKNGSQFSIHIKIAKYMSRLINIL